MHTYLLWGLAIYGLTALCIQLKKWIYRPQHLSPKHYYLLTYNSEHDIEWFLRSLSQWSKLEGQNMYLYIVDSGSEDDTISIVERLEKHGLHVQRVDPTWLDQQLLPNGRAKQDETDAHDQAAQRVVAEGPASAMVIDLRRQCAAETAAGSPSEQD
jgi:hypothetical protein